MGVGRLATFWPDYLIKAGGTSPRLQLWNERLKSTNMDPSNTLNHLPKRTSETIRWNNLYELICARWVNQGRFLCDEIFYQKLLQAFAGNVSALRSEYVYCFMILTFNSITLRDVA